MFSALFPVNHDVAVGGSIAPVSGNSEEPRGGGEKKGAFVDLLHDSLKEMLKKEKEDGVWIQPYLPDTLPSFRITLSMELQLQITPKIEIIPGIPDEVDEEIDDEVVVDEDHDNDEEVEEGVTNQSSALIVASGVSGADVSVSPLQLDAASRIPDSSKAASVYLPDVLLPEAAEESEESEDIGTVLFAKSNARTEVPVSRSPRTEGTGGDPTVKASSTQAVAEDGKSFVRTEAHPLTAQPAASTALSEQMDTVTAPRASFFSQLQETGDRTLAENKSERFTTLTDLAQARHQTDERTLKAFAEKDLSTTKLPDSSFREALEAGKITSAPPADEQKELLAPERSEPLVSVSNKQNVPEEQKEKSGSENGGSQGKNDGGVDSVATAGRNFQQVAVNDRTPFTESLARELALAGRGSVALEDGMNNVVRFMRSEGQHRASIVVEPPALGRVEIELVTTTSGIDASIRVGSEQLRQLVQDQITLLRMHLQQQGVQMTEFTVDIRDNSKGNSGREYGSGPKRGRVASTGEIDETEENIPSYRMDLEQGLLHWVA